MSDILLGTVGGLENAVFRLGTAHIKYGHFISVVIDFVVIALVVYYIFKSLEDKIDKKK